MLEEELRTSGLAADPALGLVREDVRLPNSMRPAPRRRHRLLRVVAAQGAPPVAPVFQLVLGGSRENNADAYGLGLGKVPSKNIPAVVRRLSGTYRRRAARRRADEGRRCRLGKQRIKELLADLIELPDFFASPDFYTDWRRAVPFRLQVEAGECQGELVPRVEFLLTAADSQMFGGASPRGRRLGDARRGDGGHEDGGGRAAHDARPAPQRRFDTPAEFRARFVDAGQFHAAYADCGSGRSPRKSAALDSERLHQRIEEATLFIEESHVAYSRMRT